MDDPNPYRTPRAALADTHTSSDEALANRGTRLGAAIIDTIMLLIVFVPLMYFGGYLQAVREAGASGIQPPRGLVFMWTAIGFGLFVLVHGFPLNATGQTWGQRMLGIKITDLDSSKPPLARLLGLRFLPMQIVATIPLVGGVLALINVLFIFRNDRRCVHGLIAGTKVVNANAERLFVTRTEAKAR